MHKVGELRQKAKECLEFAAKAPTPEIRSPYENLAHVWKKLAEERLAFFVEFPAADRLDEVSEGKGG